VPANKKGVFFTRRLPQNGEIRGIIVKSSTNSELYFKIQNQNFINLKHIAVNFLSQVYPLVSLSG
jgi:hypothetical protein